MTNSERITVNTLTILITTCKEVHVDPITIVSIVAFLLVMYLVTRKPAGSAKADLTAFTKYVKFRTGKGRTVSAEEVENVESFSLAMGIPFTAREEANALKSQLPKTVNKLNGKADKALALWNKLSGASKVLAYIAGVVIFAALYNIWAGPLWIMVKTSGEFLYAVLLSAPKTIAGIALFAALAYVAKKVAPMRKSKYQATAKAVASRIPEVNKMADILNQ